MASVSTDPEDNPSRFVHYQRFLADEGDLNEHNILRRSQIHEIDRLGRCVDLIDYVDSGITTKVVFKYQLVPHHLDKVWTEAHIMHALRECTSTVSFNKFVVDDTDLWMLGYVSAYIAAETLRDNSCRPFRLCWLEQLTRIVDDLNLKYGILHHDIAPCNMMIDPQTNKLIESENPVDAEDDAYGVVEIDDFLANSRFGWLDGNRGRGISKIVHNRTPPQLN